MRAPSPSRLAASVPVDWLVGGASAATGCLAVAWMLIMGSGGTEPSSLMFAATVITAMVAGSTYMAKEALAYRVRAMTDLTESIASGAVDALPPLSGPDDELARLAAAIADAARRLADLERARSELLASVSHELRTPLTVIRTIVFSELRHSERAQSRRRLALIDDEADRLSAMVDDLMAASTLEAGALRLRPVRCTAHRMLDDVRNRYGRSARERGVEVRVMHDRADAEVVADPRRLLQILSNLVANAIDHAPAGTAVTVRSTKHGSAIHFDVIDAGPGIPREQLSAIFQPFAQGDASTGRAGLGLSVARGLARAHGGDVRVETEPGRTCFRLVLPAAQTASRPAPAAQHRPAGLRISRGAAFAPDPVGVAIR